MNSKMDTRKWLSEMFATSLVKHSEGQKIHSVAVIGGGSDEPELLFLRDKAVRVHFFGIEKPNEALDFKYLDLDFVNVNTDCFDLVICNQVIEHLFKLQNAFETISSLVADNGFLWITAPANNFRHGSPHYYSAGYSREFLARNLEEQRFKVLELGELCSKRVYFYRHLLRIWPTSFQIHFPLISYFGVQGSYLNKLLFNTRHIPTRLFLFLANRRWEINGDFPIETFGLFKKN